jgi:hypothetical protein
LIERGFDIVWNSETHICHNGLTYYNLWLVASAMIMPRALRVNLNHKVIGHSGHMTAHFVQSMTWLAWDSITIARLNELS